VKRADVGLHRRRENAVEPPDDEFRHHVATRAFQIGELESDQAAAEAQLAELLDDVLARFEAAGAGDDREGPGEDGDPLAALQAWLSVASYPVAVFYAPQSPFKKWTQGTLAGIAPTVATRLSRIAAALKPKLASLMARSGIDEVGVSYQFPWGVGGGVAWDVGPGSVAAAPAAAPAVTYPRIQLVRYPAFTGAGHEFVIELDDRTTVTAVSAT
jgi:hypothetical protein